MKQCARCRNLKPTEQFGPDKRVRDGLRAYCRECVNSYQRNWRGENKDAVHRYSRIVQLRRQYGLTLQKYDDLLARQGGKCAICRSDKPGDNTRYFHVDHDHNSGKVRGLLCGLCNKGLGCFRDNPETMRVAMEYLALLARGDT